MAQVVETRTKRSLNNILFSLIAYVLQVILGFIVRRYFIYFIGAEYLGLTALFSNVLSILSLAELGFGSAIIFAMYKPMAEKNEEKVKQFLELYKKFYLVVGFVVLGIGLALTPFVHLLINGTPAVSVNLQVVFLILLVNTTMSYFFAHRRALLYTSQRNDIESKINIIAHITSTILQLLILFTIKDYYFYLSVGIFITILNNFLVWFITQKKYRNYLGKPSEELDFKTKKEIKKNVIAMVFHKIGGVIVFGTDSILISMILINGLDTLGKYSNYILITTYVGAIIALLISSIRGSVGNSIATQSVEDNFRLREKLNFVFFWIVGFCAVCIFVLSGPFISVILTKSSSVNLLLGNEIVLLVSVSFFLTYSRYLTGVFLETAGLFHPWRFSAIIESAINLVASILLGLWIGLAGIILGTILSTILMPLWVAPHVLNKYYFKKSTFVYMGKYLIYAGATLTAGLVTWFVCSFVPNGTILLLVAKFAICAVLPNIVLFLCLCWMPEFKQAIQWLISLLKLKKN
ncbi:MAG: hypothetical protein EOM55_00065 [Clostridia bacterium]|nr:hypothetical protein [Clostridia bacterium]